VESLIYPLRCRVANGANFTVVVSRRDGLKGALRGNGLGPCTEAVILRVDVGETRVEVGGIEEEGISR
jgi:hypothetical protein